MCALVRYYRLLTPRPRKTGDLYRSRARRRGFIRSVQPTKEAGFRLDVALQELRNAATVAGEHGERVQEALHTGPNRGLSRWLESRGLGNLR